MHEMQWVSRLWREMHACMQTARRPYEQIGGQNKFSTKTSYIHRTRHAANVETVPAREAYPIATRHILLRLPIFLHDIGPTCSTAAPAATRTA